MLFSTLPVWQKNLWACAAVAFIVSSGTSQIAPILPLYIEEMGITDTDELSRWSGMVYSCTFLSLAIFSPIWGALADKRGRKLMVLRALAWISICMMLISMASSVYQLAALRLMQGALSGFQGALFPLVLSMTPRERSNWAMSVLVTGLMSGTLIGPVIGGWIGDTFGFRENFFIMSGHALAGFLVVLFLVKEDFSPPVNKAALGLPLLARLKDSFSFPVTRTMVLLFITTFITMFSLMTVTPIVTVYVKILEPDIDHLPLIAGIVFSSAGIASLLFATRVGRFLDAHGPALILPFCLVCSGLLCLPQATAQSALSLGLLRFVFGFTSVGIVPAINALLNYHIDPGHLSRACSFNLSCQSMGNFLGAFFGGSLAAIFSIPTVFAASGVLLILVGIMLLMFFPRGRTI